MGTRCRTGCLRFQLKQIQLCLIGKETMKIAAVLIAIAFLSCSYKDTAPPENSFMAKRNDLHWSGTTEIAFYHADTLQVLCIANQPNDEVLLMKIKFNGTGSYTLTNNQAYYYSTIGGDVTSSEYKLAPNTTGQLIISKYNSAEKIIDGTFEVTLKKVRSNPENNIDTYNFTAGTFRGKILN